MVHIISPIFITGITITGVLICNLTIGHCTIRLLLIAGFIRLAFIVTIVGNRIWGRGTIIIMIRFTGYVIIRAIIKTIVLIRFILSLIIKVFATSNCKDITMIKSIVVILPYWGWPPTIIRRANGFLGSLKAERSDEAERDKVRSINQKGNRDKAVDDRQLLQRGRSNLSIKSSKILEL
ncbi:Os08g0197025 [Oryza sativa Japonica Group]|uniref:Os08g0197025 protein n=1 Tax=Oryza sativa subsp. japonica TaxID=39947 RepID=A0A0P0XCM8_ORYSJ|nr:hypothetical protein EE612_042621 [Oryza sativa]BAT04221.1 Os08g0197025 [Oryza sativa Japonica Group]